MKRKKVNKEEESETLRQENQSFDAMEADSGQMNNLRLWNIKEKEKSFCQKFCGKKIGQNDSWRPVVQVSKTTNSKT